MTLLDNNSVIISEVVESKSLIRIAPSIGDKQPLYCTGVGKAILAHMPETKLERYINKTKFKQYTENTIIAKNKLRKHLLNVVKEGYAFDNEENEKGIRCVGAPIFNQQGRVIAAISISGPAVRITKKMMQQTLKNEVIRTALDISREFGYQS